MNPIRNSCPAVRPDRRTAIAEPERTFPGARAWPAALFCAFLTAALVVSGCSENPREPVFDNPFDPRTPGSANPLNLEAVFGDGKVTLTWTALDGHGIATYVVTRILLGTPYELARLDAGNGTMTYVDQEPVPNTVNIYLVRALDEYGRGAAMSHIVPAETVVPPIVSLASGLTQVRSRYQDLAVRSTPDQYVEVDNSPSFAGAVQVLVGQNGTAVVPGFDLGPRPSPAARCTLYTRAVDDHGDDPIVGKLVLRILFSPAINLPDSTFTVARPWTDLVISHQAAGVRNMRLAPSAAELESAAWLFEDGAVAPLIEDWPLLDTASPQSVHAEFTSEFEFTDHTHKTTLNLTADDLAGASFALDLPPNRVAETPVVGVLNDAVATEMRISQHPDFRDAPWTPYDSRPQITLAGDPGLYQIYARFRNHWHLSAILTDHVILSGAGIAIAFTHPTEGLTVQGGTMVELSGTAATFDEGLGQLLYPLTLVEVHTPGDGWRPAEGTAEWSAPWDVPAHEADTEVLIGARATATGPGGDTHEGVVWISVLIEAASGD